MFLEKALRTRGFTRMQCVENGRVALEAMGRFKPELVILDIMMPEMDGFECCEKIRAMPAYRGLPILVQTSLTEPEQRVKAFAKGATDFVNKPIHADELGARVKVHLENRLLLKGLKIYKQRVEQELESARQLQQAILPGVQEITAIEQGCRLDIASHFQPSSEIGGDFWGIKNLFPQQTALWLVDFSGHGVASALNAFRLQAYLKEYSPHAAYPGEYLARLNDNLLRLLLRGQFAAMFYGIADTQGNTLLYASSGTPHPILVRKSTGKAEMIDGSGMPLGIAVNNYPTRSTDFHEGDMLLLYSDALTETPDENGRTIAEGEVMAFMEAHIGVGSHAAMAALLDMFNRHAGGRLADDLTLVICTRCAAQ